MAEGDGWFADHPGDDDSWSEGVEHMWMPFLQEGGCCMRMSVWFYTEEDCNNFIRRAILGNNRLLDD